MDDLNYETKLMADGFKCVEKGTESDIDQEQVKICQKFLLENVEPSETKNRYWSYYWKHRVEDFTITKENPYYTYISNGAFIQSCLNLGFKIKKADGLNAYVWIKLKKGITFGGMKQ